MRVFNRLHNKTSLAIARQKLVKQVNKQINGYLILAIKANCGFLVDVF